MGLGQSSQYSKELQAGQPRLQILKGQNILSSPKPSTTTLGSTQPPIQWIWHSFQWVKQLGCEADQPLTSI